MKLILIAMGGAFGALARYSINLFTQTQFDSRFPFGTLLANAIGCFLLGFLFEFILIEKLDGEISQHIKTALSVGFLGALTTFSTFSLESIHAIEKGHWEIAFLNIAANGFLGFGGLYLGLSLGRLSFQS